MKKVIKGLLLFALGLLLGISLTIKSAEILNAHQIAVFGQVFSYN